MAQNLINQLNSRIVRINVQIRKYDNYKKYKGNFNRYYISRAELTIFEQYVKCGNVNIVLGYLNSNNIRNEDGNLFTIGEVLDVILRRPKVIPLEFERLVGAALRIYTYNSKQINIQNNNFYPLGSVQGPCIR